MLYDTFLGCRNKLLRASGWSSNQRLQQSLVARWPGKSPQDVILPTYTVLFLAGIYTTWYLGHKNGVFAHIDMLIEHDHPEIPGSYMPLIVRWTPITSLDRRITRFVAFSAPIVDGSWPALSLLGFFGAGQLCAIWTLMLLESRRKGNEGTWFGVIGRYAFIFQNIYFAVTAPIFFLAHLLKSSVARQFPGAFATTVLHVPSSDLHMLPLSVTFGFILPTFLAMLPYPTYVSCAQHQFFIACWPLFPIYTLFAHKALTYVYSSVESRVNYSNQAPASLAASYLRSVRPVYTFVMAVCVFTSVPVYLLTLCPNSLARGSEPSTPNPLDHTPPHTSTIWTVLAELARVPFKSVFVPSFVGARTAAEYPPLATGVHVFLQWHIYISCITCLIWGVYLYSNATTERLSENTTALPKYRDLLTGDRRRDETIRQWRLAGKVAAWTTVAGPMGALTMLLWERDHIVRQKIKQGI